MLITVWEMVGDGGQDVFLWSDVTHTVDWIEAVDWTAAS